MNYLKQKQDETSLALHTPQIEKKNKNVKTKLYDNPSSMCATFLLMSFMLHDPDA